MSINSANKNVKSYIHIIIMFILMLGTGFLPEFGQITALGMKVLGVFLGLLYGWIFVDLLWPSVLGFFMLGLTGVTTPLGGLISGFTNPTTVMVMISYAFAYCLSQVGVNEAIAYWVMGRKAFVGKPWLLITAIVLTALVMSIFGGGFASIFMMWGVVKIIADANEIKEGKLILSMLYALILYAGMHGGTMVPFMGGCILYGGFLTKATGVVVEGPAFLFIGELYGALAMIAIILIVKYIFKADASQFLLKEEMRAKYATYKLSSKQIVGLVTVVIYFMSLLLPSVLQGAIWTMLAKWGIVGISIIYMTIFAIWKDENGNSMCSMQDCFQKGISWGPILLFMITIPLAAAMESQEVGILATVNAFCVPLLSGMSVNALLIWTVIIIGLLTQILHNVVMAAIFIPILAPIVIGMGGNPMTFFFVIYSALCCSFVTPAASMQAALIFAKDGVPAKHAYLTGLLFYLVTVVIVIALIPLCNIMFAGFMS